MHETDKEQTESEIKEKIEELKTQLSIIRRDKELKANKDKIGKMFVIDNCNSFLPIANHYTIRECYFKVLRVVKDGQLQGIIFAINQSLLVRKLTHVYSKYLVEEVTITEEEIMKEHYDLIDEGIFLKPKKE